MLRRLASLAAVTAVAFTAIAAAAPAANASSEESQFVSLTNSARSGHGLHAYSVSSDLVAVARKHSQEMAAKHTIYHNSNLANDVSGWQMVGENVGMGGSASSIHNAFMNSTAHRANILDTDFTQVGIGTAFDDKGVLYVTEVFRKPSGSSAPAPAPAPRRTTTVRRTSTVRTTTAARSTTVRPAAAKPAAKPAAKAVDTGAALRARLRAAQAVAGSSEGVGALGHAVTYSQVMRTLC